MQKMITQNCSYDINIKTNLKEHGLDTIANQMDKMLYEMKNDINNKSKQEKAKIITNGAAAIDANPLINRNESIENNVKLNPKMEIISTVSEEMFSAKSLTEEENQLQQRIFIEEIRDVPSTTSLPTINNLRFSLESVQLPPAEIIKQIINSEKEDKIKLETADDATNEKNLELSKNTNNNIKNQKQNTVQLKTEDKNNDASNNLKKENNEIKPDNNMETSQNDSTKNQNKNNTIKQTSIKIKQNNNNAIKPNNNSNAIKANNNNSVTKQNKSSIRKILKNEIKKKKNELKKNTVIIKKNNETKHVINKEIKKSHKIKQNDNEIKQNINNETKKINNNETGQEYNIATCNNKKPKTPVKKKASVIKINNNETKQQEYNIAPNKNTPTTPVKKKESVNKINNNETKQQEYNIAPNKNNPTPVKKKESENKINNNETKQQEYNIAPNKNNPTPVKKKESANKINNNETKLNNISKQENNVPNKNKLKTSLKKKDSEIKMNNEKMKQENNIAPDNNNKPNNTPNTPKTPEKKKDSINKINNNETKQAKQENNITPNNNKPNNNTPNTPNNNKPSNNTPKTPEKRNESAKKKKISFDDQNICDDKCTMRQAQKMNELLELIDSLTNKQYNEQKTSEKQEKIEENIKTILQMKAEIINQNIKNTLDNKIDLNNTKKNTKNLVKNKNDIKKQTIIPGVNAPQVITSDVKAFHITQNKFKMNSSSPLNRPVSLVSSGRSNISKGTIKSYQNFRIPGHTDPWQDFLNLVNKAKNDRKIFTVCGNFFSVKRSLVERGWLEKVRQLVTDSKEFKQYEHMPNLELFEGMKNKENSEKYRRALITKLLARHQVDFYWDYATNPFNVNSDKVKHTIINRYPLASTRVYGSKAGLCESLSEAHWYCIEGVANIRYPRTYNLAYEYDKQAFIEDFQLTAAASLLKWITKTSTDPVIKLISSTGKIPVAVFNFAVLQCQNYIKIKQHKDIDEPITVPKQNDWDVFLDKFYKLIHNVNHFKESNKISSLQMVEQSKAVLKKMERFWPHMSNDGYMNLWLLKPHNGSQGYGILICRTLKYILETISNAKNKKYVVQKYIERPLLIYNTKFDIRQWFLLTHQPYLQLWMYKECYLRFSSQTYCLHKLHESIHLTNNSIQCRYKNNCDRNSALPMHNMWHCDTFKHYLHDIGHPNVWKNVIYKEMKEAMISIIMCCQDKIIARVNSFEICGVDFMLTEDFHPFLIEINTKPALYNSTPITAKLCPSVLEDVIKVTVDYARNPKASTGKFEMIYKDRQMTKAFYDKGSVLAIHGKNYFTKYKNQEAEKKDPVKKSVDTNSLDSSVIQNILNINPDQVKKDVKTTLEKILSIIHVEREKRIADQEQREYQSETFKNMLSEFVTIISSGVTSPHGKNNEMIK